MNVSIDSMKVRIPLDKVEILDSAVSGHFVEVEVSTGEVDPETFKRKRKRVGPKGPDGKLMSTTGYMIEKVTSKGRQIREFLVINLNSKILESAYLSGINSSTIDAVYRLVMEQKIIRCDKPTFLNSDCTDVDIKSDYEVSGLKAQFDIVSSTKLLVKLSDRVGHGVIAHQTDGNIGVQFNTRTTSTDARPFIKMYAKDVELRHNSREFYNAFLKGEKLPHLMRIEGQIKNASHWRYMLRRLGIPLDRDTPLTLNSILSCSVLDEMLSLMLSQNIEEHGKLKPKITSPNKPIATSDLITRCLLHATQSLSISLRLVERWATDPERKYRARRKVIENYEVLSGSGEISENFEDVDGFFNWIFHPQNLYMKRSEEIDKLSDVRRPGTWSKEVQNG